jgi:large subunit ribosomal protein L24
MKKIKIKKGDLVQVMSGKDKGAKGHVLEVLRKKDRVVVEGVNIIKKRIKPTAENPSGVLWNKKHPFIFPMLCWWIPNRGYLHGWVTILKTEKKSDTLKNPEKKYNCYELRTQIEKRI